MKKSTLFLLALGGAVLATSLTLNVCFYQQFDQARKHAAAEKYKNRRKAVSPKKAVDAKKKAEKVQPEPLMLASTGHYRHHTIYARFSRSGLELVNLSPELISISPSLPFTLESESYGDHIMIKADFQPETAYKVVIRKGLEDSDG